VSGGAGLPAGQPSGHVPGIRPGPIVTYVVLGLIVAVGAWLRLDDLTAQSLWYDEIITWRQTRGTLAELFSLTANDNYPPLYNLLTYVSVNLLGETELGLRLPAALLGIGNIVAIYFLASRLGGAFAGLAAALLLALSGFHIWYSQEARMYSLLALTATLFAMALLDRLMSLAPRRPWLLWLAGTALLYSHPFGLPTWLSMLGGAAMAAWLVRGTWIQPLRSLIFVSILTGLSFVPWAILLARRAAIVNERGFWVPDPTWAFVWSQVKVIATGPFGLALLATGAVLALGFALRPAETRDTGTPRLAGVLIFLASWAALPSLAAIAASQVIEPFFYARYAIGCLPAIAGLAALGLAPLCRNLASATAVALATVSLSTVAIALDTLPERERWRDIGAAVVADSRDDDCLILDPDWQRTSLSYYARSLPDCRVSSSPYDKFSDLPADPARVVLIVSRRSETRARLAERLPDRKVTMQIFGDVVLYTFTEP
jgi:mannosyltransferase